MKRDTAKVINECMATTSGSQPEELLIAAEHWIDEAREQTSDEEADKRIASAAACLVAYLEWKQ